MATFSFEGTIEGVTHNLTASGPARAEDAIAKIKRAHPLVKNLKLVTDGAGKPVVLMPPGGKIEEDKKR